MACESSFLFALKLLHWSVRLGWRQAKHLKKKVKQYAREVSRISASKSPRVKATLNQAYAKLLGQAGDLIEASPHAGKKGPQGLHCVTAARYKSPFLSSQLRPLADADGECLQHRLSSNPTWRTSLQ